jgi:transposase-like protein
MSLQQGLDAAMHSITKLVETANQAAAAINRKVIESAQRNVNAGFDLAKSLAEVARTPSVILALHTRYWRKQFGELTSQAEETSNRLFTLGAAKSRMPELESEPPRKSPTRLQKAHKRARQDSANAALWRNPGAQSPKTPRSTARTARPEIQKKGAPIDKPKMIQRSSGRAPLDEKTRLRAQPSSSTARQPTDIRFGMLDGNAVRFTNLEAWWLVDGTWRRISSDEVLSNAAVMREARFKQFFPHIPLLPEDAFQSRQR